MPVTITSPADCSPRPRRRGSCRYHADAHRAVPVTGCKLEAVVVPVLTPPQPRVKPPRMATKSVARPYTAAQDARAHGRQSLLRACVLRASSINHSASSTTPAATARCAGHHQCPNQSGLPTTSPSAPVAPGEERHPGVTSSSDRRRPAAYASAQEAGCAVHAASLLGLHRLALRLSNRCLGKVGKSDGWLLSKIPSHRLRACIHRRYSRTRHHAVSTERSGWVNSTPSTITSTATSVQSGTHGTPAASTAPRP